MESEIENYKDLWDAKRREYDAKAERLSAELRLEYNDMFDNYAAQIDAAKDWTEAEFKELLAKADAKWQEFEMRNREE